MEKITFFWYDYIVFSVMILGSSIIGIYFGCFGKKGDTKTEYLMGGRRMMVLPVIISLIASHTSGISLLALPAEVYMYGASYGLGFISMAIVSVVTVHIFLPVFHNLQLTSTYEYLERRFDRKTRKLASTFFSLQLLTYLPIVIYIPALAFAAASNISVHYVTPILCGICIFYTTIGGLKAVVWTDTLKFTITLGAMAIVFFIGLKSVGGITEVWNRAIEGQRLDVFDFDIDPTKRETFWAIVIGLTVHWIAQVSINQACTQKFLSIPTLRSSQLAVYGYCVGMSVVKIISVITGLIIYTKYGNCDPFEAKILERSDQLVPYYVIDVAGGVKGLAALFIAGVFCTALSTLSTNINCLAGTIYEDFISQYVPPNKQDRRVGMILKLIVVCTGILSTLMVYIVERLGGLLSLTIALSGATDGALLGMFILGLLFPKANTKGAFYGSICAVVCMSVVVIGNNFHKSEGYLKLTSKPVSMRQCDLNLTLTTPYFHQNETYVIVPNEPVFLFRISFYWYTLIGTVITVISGLIISYLRNKESGAVDPKLMSPVARFWISKEDHDFKKSLYENGKVEETLKCMHDYEETEKI